MKSPSHQVIGSLPQISADPIPDMPTIDMKKEET